MAKKDDLVEVIEVYDRDGHLVEKKINGISQTLISKIANVKIFWPGVICIIDKPNMTWDEANKRYGYRDRKNKIN